MPVEVTPIQAFDLVAPKVTATTDFTFEGVDPVIVQVEATHQLIVTSTGYYISTTDASTQITTYGGKTALSKPGVHPQVTNISKTEYIVKTDAGLSKITLNFAANTNVVTPFETTGPTID